MESPSRRDTMQAPCSYPSSSSLPRLISALAVLIMAPFCSADNAPVRLRVERTQVVLDNGLLVLTLTNPGGDIESVAYNGVNNLMEPQFALDRRGYWDISWKNAGGQGGMDGWRIQSSKMKVIREDEGVVELSFTSGWDNTAKTPPLNFDKRYVMLRGSSGFYTYAIYEHQRGWPDLNIYESRVALKLDKNRFHYMAVADDRQRMMPMLEDRMPGRGEELAYKEAVRLVNPIESQFKGEVDDKYQYSMDNIDSKVHGWISADPPIGLWMITPSIESKTGGPLKQDLTSHTGPVTLAMFISVHYTGDDIAVQLRNGEYWKKVFGPVFIYLNSNPGAVNKGQLWSGAKQQQEVNNWPYEFVASKDFPKKNERGSVDGRLFVRDRLVDAAQVPAASAYVGLAPVGDIGSWQTESKGYQFWVVTDKTGQFSIPNVRPGQYNLFAWVPGYIGEYKYESVITIAPGKAQSLGDLIYEPPRDGPTLWEIGIPDRSAAEFYIPDPKPDLVNPLYVNTVHKFRQYGLWDRYSEIYAAKDLVYTVGTSDYKKDWFYAHVNRKVGDNKPYEKTTWQIKFNLEKVVPNSVYKFRLAIASATSPILHVWFNDPQRETPHFSTEHIRAENNAIARHAIRAMYWLFTGEIQSNWLVQGENVVYLTQTNGKGAFAGLMYDYIRLEGPNQ